MKRNMIIYGYGNIGRHMHSEFAALNPDIYDPFIPDYAERPTGRYDLAFVCVPTEGLPDGSCDTSVVESAVKEVNAETIVIKSTEPPGTTERLVEETGKTIVFSPENYGTTQHCAQQPGFVILGGGREACGKVAEFYAEVKNGYFRMYFTDARTAELWKYMLNAYLALKVTFCCEFADIAEKFGVSYPELRELFVADERVGASHTFVYTDKPYYDSHCFNKDVPALVSFAGEAAPLAGFMEKLNVRRKRERNGK